ncbi:MAG: hypothetical protein IPK23_04615 [Rhizobiales bacterium]|jgi:hypothetical protein|nr:hypothetical protein [Hyphomicrobiales bacterium]
MKAKSLFLAILSLGVLAVTAADAQNRGHPPYDAWCRDVQTGVGGGTVMICRAYTYEQCMAGRTSHVETCYANPLYDPRNAEWRRRNPNY